ncbi:Desaturase 6, partial [Operophtera brumata]
MAPTEQNIEDSDIQHSQVKKRLNNGLGKFENEMTCFENNNTVLVKSDSDTNKSDIFDINKYEAMEFTAQWRWPDTIVQVLLHTVSLYAVYLILTLQVKFLTIFVGFGITAGVHRLWSHRAYKARLPMRVLLAVLFTITGQRDIYTWALDHRVHHKYTETVADPHDIRRGFWFAHVGWLVLTPHPAVEDRRAALMKTSLDLMADPVVRLQQ